MYPILEIHIVTPSGKVRILKTLRDYGDQIYRMAVNLESMGYTVDVYKIRHNKTKTVVWRELLYTKPDKSR